MPTVTHTDALAQFGCAISDPTRARVLLALRDAPAYPADLAEQLGVSRSRLSNHLACLRGCGLVETTAEGRRTRYGLADPVIAQTIGDLMNLVLTVDPDCCDKCSAEDGGACCTPEGGCC